MSHSRCKPVSLSWCSSSISVKRSMPLVHLQTHHRPFYCRGCWHCLTSFSLPTPPTIPHNKPKLLRFCFFGFDRLRFDWSSSDRLGGYGRCRGWFFFCFFLTGTRWVSQCFRRFTWITVHFLGFASYLFVLLLFREEPLRGLKNLCSLFCLKKLENKNWKYCNIT